LPFIFDLTGSKEMNKKNNGGNVLELHYEMYKRRLRDLALSHSHSLGGISRETVDTSQPQAKPKRITPKPQA